MKISDIPLGAGPSQVNFDVGGGPTDSKAFHISLSRPSGNEDGAKGPVGQGQGEAQANSLRSRGCRAFKVFPPSFADLVARVLLYRCDLLEFEICQIGG